MTGGEAAEATLRALGVRHVFGIVSVHNIPIYDAILRVGEITPVAVRHEQGATHAADGYSRATGRLGVAITSTGPGCVNSLPGLYEAGFASSRVLMLTGQIDTKVYGKGKGFLHEAERQVAMLQSVCRRVESVRRTADIPSVIRRVAGDIMTGRPQPGAIEIPIDLQYASAEVDIPQGEPGTRIAPDEASLAAAVEALGSAQRPLIWAGGGAVTSGGAAALTALAEKLRAPVLTTIQGRGAIPEDHDLCLGAVTAHPALRETLTSADVLLAVGTRFQAGDTGQWTLPLPKLVHLDAEPGVIGRNYVAAVALVADARLGLEALLAALDAKTPDESFLDGARGGRDAARAASRQMIGPDYEAIMDAIREHLPRDGVVARDATVPAYLWGDRLLPILEPMTSMRPTSAAIGPGLPLAIGAAIGSGKRTVLIAGDGGLMLNVGELATAVQYRLPLVVCVFNDGGYGILRAIQDRTFDGRQVGVDLQTPDFAALARAVGMEGERVEGVDAFRDAFKRAVDREGPTLLDIDMDALQPMAAFGRPSRRS